MPTNDLYEVSTRQSLLGQVLINTIHVREVAATLTEGERQSTLQIFADAFKDLTKANQHNTVTYQTWRASQVQGAGVTYNPATCKKVGGKVYEGNLTGALAGAEAGGAVVATFAAMIIKEGTGFAGRSRRGRIHIGGVSTSLSNATVGQIPAAVSNQTTVINSFRALYGPVAPAASWEVIVWSRRLATGCSPASTHPHALVSRGDQDLANSWKAVTSMVSVAPLGTMVRRKIGVGV